MYLNVNRGGALAGEDDDAVDPKTGAEEVS